MKKTFKIGEEAVGGIVEVLLNVDEVTIHVKDWDTKEVLETTRFSVYNLDSILTYLWNITTPYYATKIISYIKDLSQQTN